MEKIVNFDKQGRLYIPQEIRKSLQFKTLLAKTNDKGLILEPIEDDPIESLTRLGKGKLKKSIEKLKKEARREIENATKKIC